MSSINGVESFTASILNLFPVIVMVGIILMIFSFLWDGSIFHGFRRYWWVIAIMGFPLLVIIGGVDVFWIIGVLIGITVVGGLFFWWLENDFEMPKGDPVKKGFQWLRKNFRM